MRCRNGSALRGFSWSHEELWDLEACKGLECILWYMAPGSQRRRTDVRGVFMGSHRTSQEVWHGGPLLQMGKLRDFELVSQGTSCKGWT